MGLISYKLGQTSIVLRVLIQDSSSTTGAGLTGLTFSSTGLKIGTIANNEASSTAYTVAGSTIETITTLGTYAAPTATKCRFKEVDATNHPGVYEVQLADARYAVSSAKSILVSITGATNAAPCHALIPLVQVDPYTTPGTVGGLLINGANTNALGTFALPDIAIGDITLGLLAISDDIYFGSDTVAKTGQLTTVAGYIDTEVAAIKAKTDQLTFTTANRVDASSSGGGDATAANQATIIKLIQANTK